MILISRTGQTVRLSLADIRITGRNTQGVILAKLKDEDDTFIGTTLAEVEEPDESSEHSTSDNSIE